MPSGVVIGPSRRMHGPTERVLNASRGRRCGPCRGPDDKRPVRPSDAAGCCSITQTCSCARRWLTGLEVELEGQRTPTTNQDGSGTVADYRACALCFGSVYAAPAVISPPGHLPSGARSGWAAVD